MSCFDKSGVGVLICDEHEDNSRVLKNKRIPKTNKHLFFLLVIEYLESLSFPVFLMFLLILTLY